MKYYVVWRGVQPGVYASWAECKAQVEGFDGALYKSFPSEAAARSAFNEPPHLHIGAGKAAAPKATAQTGSAQCPPIVGDAWAVDAACSGNPGPMEYRCVDLADGKEVFHYGPTFGTNNIGEFLAIVHALALMKQQGVRRTIYSDSRNAMNWVRHGHCKTRLPMSQKSATVHDLIARAERWLAANPIDVPILKWQTDEWGEVPADFGRK